MQENQHKARLSPSRRGCSSASGACSHSRRSLLSAGRTCGSDTQQPSSQTAAQQHCQRTTTTLVLPFVTLCVEVLSQSRLGLLPTCSGDAHWLEDRELHQFNIGHWRDFPAVKIVAIHGAAQMKIAHSKNCVASYPAGRKPFCLAGRVSIGTCLCRPGPGATGTPCFLRTRRTKSKRTKTSIC